MTKCSVENCDGKTKARGWCEKHYFRFIRHGSTEINKRVNERHGMTRSIEHEIWLGMRARCNNKNCDAYSRYGGRGIKVCPEWDSFLCFFNDMGKKPEGKDIDRIDNDKGYSKDNCRWASRSENAQNKSDTKLNADAILRIRSSSLSMKELSSIYKVSTSHICNIINKKACKNV